MAIELDFLGTSPEETLRIVNGEVIRTPTGVFFDAWSITDDEIQAAVIELQLRGDTLVINSISSEGGPSTLGPAKIRSAFRLLVQEYPGVTKIAGQRTTGIRTKGRKTFIGDFDIPQVEGSPVEVDVSRIR